MLVNVGATDTSRTHKLTFVPPEMRQCSSPLTEGPRLHPHDGKNRVLGRQTPIFTFILLVPRVRDTSKSTKVGCVTSMFFIEVIELLITQAPDGGTRGRGWLLGEHHHLHLKESKCPERRAVAGKRAE